MSEKVEDLLNSLLTDDEDEYFDVEEASIREEMRRINNELIIHFE